MRPWQSLGWHVEGRNQAIYMYGHRELGVFSIYRECIGVQERHNG